MVIPWIRLWLHFFGDDERDKYYEIFIDRGILIFVDFVVHLNHEHWNPTKYNFLIDCCLVVFETTNSRTQGSMHFAETTKIGSNKEKYIHSTCIAIGCVRTLFLCLSQDRALSFAYARYFCVQVLVNFVDISGIVDHYCVKFLVIIFENFVYLTKKNNQLTEFFLCF